MALIYFYDANELDKEQLTAGLKDTDHHWEYVEDGISVDNLNPDTEVISVFVSSTVTAEIIDALPKLRLIACRSTGFNNVDLAKAEERDITVLNVPSYGESTVAEYAFTLLLALTRKLPQTLDAFDEEVAVTALMGNDLSEKTIGVVGSGRIGQHVIKIANGFNMNVIAYDPFPKKGLDQELGFTYVSLEDLLSQSDFVSIHAPFVGTNKHLINAENLQLMKPSALLINTARGELVDTKALAQALQEKRIAGAALDVIEGEKLMHVHEDIALLRSPTASLGLFENGVELLALHKMPNVIVTPHNAFNSIEAVNRINSTTTDNIIKFWYGKKDNLVKPSAKARGKLVIVRHTESEWNETGRWTGITDVHLSQKGFHDAGQFGVALRELDIPINQSFCSQQIRTLETLEGILDASQQFDVPIEREAAINERDYGGYTGKNKWEMKELLGEESFNKIRRGWEEPIPDGETLKMVYERVLPFYKERVVPLLNAGKNVLIVAHGNSIRAMMKYIESLDTSQVESLEMLFGVIVIYDVNEDGTSAKRSEKMIATSKTNA
jgi:D-lactate dehydrogenase